MPPNSLL